MSEQSLSTIQTSIQKWEEEANNQTSKEIVLVVPIASPEAVKDIPKIELEIKRLDQIAKATKEKRLSFTRLISEYTSRLMGPEKWYEDKVVELKKDLLPIKLIEEKIKNDKLKRQQELVDFKQKQLFAYNSLVEKVNKYIQDTVTKMYSDALDAEAMSGAEYIEAFSESIAMQAFDIEIPVSNDKEKQEIIDLVWSSWSQRQQHENLVDEIYKAFDNFDIDVKDKAAAAEMRKAAQIASDQKAESEKAMNDSFVENVVVVRQEVSDKTKKLKKVQVLNMPEDFQTMTELLKAFSGAMVSGREAYRGNNYFDVLEPIVKVIEGLKNKGMDFPTLKFKEESKL